MKDLRPTEPQDRRKKLSSEAQQRLADCRRQKDAVGEDLREGYFFTRPRLHRQIRSDSKPDTTTPRDASELVTGVGTEVAEDFATEVINAFFPPHFEWCESKAAGGVPAEAWDQVKDAAKEIDRAVFQEIRASNFDAELSSALVPDVALGTVAIFVDETTGFEPIRCQHVPIRELELNVGPYGDVDDRFIVRHVRYRSLRSVLPDVAIPAEHAKRILKKPMDWCRVVWGYWRDWSERADEVWQRVVMIGDDVVDEAQLRGAGCCPLIVMRFSPDSLHAFGNGPTLSALPDLRVLDMLTEAQQNRASQSMRPPFAFPDDGVMNFEQGIEDGKAYPKRPSQGSQIEPLYFTGDVNFGLFTIEDVERRVRRKHFADYPHQPGKTPPTATQWVDEMAKSQRRIGTPGARFFWEGPAQVFKRFRYLAEKRGTIEALRLDRAVISTQPSNPATKAQEQQEVMTAVRLLEILNGFFPQIMAAVVDPLATATTMKEKLGDRIVALREQDEVVQMMQMLLDSAPEAAAAVEGEAA